MRASYGGRCVEGGGGRREELGMRRECVVGDTLAPMSRIRLDLFSVPNNTFVNVNCSSRPVHEYTIFICIR